MHAKMHLPLPWKHTFWAVLLPPPQTMLGCGSCEALPGLPAAVMAGVLFPNGTLKGRATLYFTSPGMGRPPSERGMPCFPLCQLGACFSFCLIFSAGRGWQHPRGRSRGPLVACRPYPANTCVLLTWLSLACPGEYSPAGIGLA